MRRRTANQRARFNEQAEVVTEEDQDELLVLPEVIEVPEYTPSSPSAPASEPPRLAFHLVDPGDPVSLDNGPDPRPVHPSPDALGTEESQEEDLASPHWRVRGTGQGLPRTACADDLQEAALRGDVRFLKKLIEAGVSVNTPLRVAGDDEFMLVLHALVCRHDVPNGARVLTALLEAKVNACARTSMGSSALMLACWHKNVKATEILLDTNVDPELEDDLGRNAACYTVMLDYSDDTEVSVMILNLLSEACADLDVGGARSPIEQAVLHENGPAVTALIALGAAPHGLHAAAMCGPLSLIYELIAAQANPFLLDEDSRTVLELAIARGDMEITNVLRDYVGDLERNNHPFVRDRPNTRSLAERGSKDGTEQRPSRFFTEGDARSIEAALAKQKRDAKQIHGRVDLVFKAIVRNGCFKSFMLFVLMCALFLPDLWIIMNIPDDTVLDVVVIFIFVCFSAEFIIQLLGQYEHYYGRFTFWMDLVALCTVPLDHSLFSQILMDAFDVDGPELARVTKMVKLGGRAGRLFRLGKLLRFLPGMNNKTDDKVADARAISGALNAQLSNMVSCVILLVVLSVPVVELFRYPLNDNSMESWVRLIDVAFRNGNFSSVELIASHMEAFYSDVNYFPYVVNLIFSNGSSIAITLRGSAPARWQDKLTIDAGDQRVYAVFNFRGPNLLEAIVFCVLIVCIIATILMTAVMLQRSITFIILTPLEYLFTVVRSSATRIFDTVEKVADKLLANEDDAPSDESSDEEREVMSRETRLLEKVMQKLNALGEIHMHGNAADVVDMRLEDRALLRDYLGRQPLDEAKLEEKKKEKDSKEIPRKTSKLSAERRNASKLSSDPSGAAIRFVASAPGARREDDPMLKGKSIQEREVELEEELQRTVDMAWEDVRYWDLDILILSLKVQNSLCTLILTLHSKPLDKRHGDNAIQNWASETSTEVAAPRHKFSEYRRISDSSAASASSRQSKSASSKVAPDSDAAASSDRVPDRTPSLQSAISAKEIKEAMRSASLRKSFHKRAVHSRIAKFVAAVERGYEDKSALPYHSWDHAVDTAHVMHCSLCAWEAGEYLPLHERTALIISALGHDIGHPGRNNSFLVETEDELALLYNDKEPLENMHCAKLFEILSMPSCVIFAELDRFAYLDARETCVEAILHTDIMRHARYVSELRLQMSIQPEMFEALPAELEEGGGYLPAQVLDFFWSPDVRRLLKIHFLVLADMSNPTRPWTLCQEWARRQSEEFFLQGDRELLLGHPVQPLFDRGSSNVARAQIAFIEFFVAPVMQISTKLMPPMWVLEEAMWENLDNWIAQWRETATPLPEDNAAVMERCNKRRSASENQFGSQMSEMVPVSTDKSEHAFRLAMRGSHRAEPERAGSKLRVPT